MDLIVGLVRQTDESFLTSLDRVIKMGPQSVTIYQLEIPHNTPLYKRLAGGNQPGSLATWDLKRRRLARGFEALEQAGYTLRSAYTAVRDAARHHFIYQDAQYHGADLLGIGASAFSYLGGIHFQNVATKGEYFEAVHSGGSALGRAYTLSDEERLIREFILQLKLGAVDARYFQEKFRADIIARFAGELARLHRRGWLTLDDWTLRLTRQGLLRVDQLLSGFYRPCHQNLRYS